MKKVNKLLHLVLGFSAGLLAGAFIRMGFEIIDGRPAAIGGQALDPAAGQSFVVGFGVRGLGNEVKAQGTRSAGFTEKGYRRGYHKGLEDGTVEIHSHIDVYHFPEEFQVRSE